MTYSTQRIINLTSALIISTAAWAAGLALGLAAIVFSCATGCAAGAGMVTAGAAGVGLNRLCAMADEPAAHAAVEMISALVRLMMR